MKKILVSLTALIVALSCMLALCACDVPTVLPDDDNDITLGGGSGDKGNKDDTSDEDDDLDFDPTDSTDSDDDTPVLEPDTVPATPGLVFKLNSDGKSYRVFDYFSNSGETLSTEVYIPYTYEGLPVTGIGHKAFDGVESLTAVVLPKTLVSIAEYAFYECKSLVALDIPASLKTIGVSAFDGCNSLSDIVVDEGNEIYASIGSSLVEKATGMLVLGSNSSTIPADGSVTAIGNNAFRGKSIVSIDIPDSVTAIGRGAFADCSRLTAVTLPLGLQVIEDSTFIRCSSLEGVTIPDTVTSIGYSAFEGCAKLSTIDLLGSVSEIGGRAFMDCRGLASFTFNEGLLTIGGEAFCGCDKLADALLPLSLEYIGSGAFRDCKALKTVTFNPVYVEYDIKDSGVGISLDSKLALIENGAFQGCYSLELVVIPRATEVIGAYAFYGCNNSSLIIYCEATRKPLSWQTYWNSGSTATVFYYSNSQGSATTWHYVEVDGTYQIEMNTGA